MKKEIDKSLVGKKINFLTILDVERENSKLYCKCKCDCGNIVRVYKGNITSNSAKSCGCRKNRKIAVERLGKLIGKRFGNLIVEDEYIKENKLVYCKCKCDCGNEREVKKRLLINNKITHCYNCLLPYEKLKEKKYGKLIILNIFRLNSKIFCECKCDCGNVIKVLKSNLLNGKKIDCGCRLKEKKKQVILHKKFEKLEVIDTYTENNKLFCKCKCDCGNVIKVLKSNLLNGKKTDCGCLKEKGVYSNIIGKRYGRLIVINEISTIDKNGHKHFICKCDCGNTVEVLGQNLKYKQTESCGCLKKISLYNTKLRKNNKSGVKGVYFDNKSQKWVAFVSIKGKKIRRYCSSFDLAEKKRKELEEIYYKPIIDDFNNNG